MDNEQAETTVARRSFPQTPPSPEGRFDTLPPTVNVDSSSSTQVSQVAVDESKGDTPQPISAFPSNTEHNAPLSSDSEPKAPTSKAPEQWITGVPFYLVILGLTLVMFLMLLDISIVATAVPKITNQFHSLDDVAWYGSAYTLASFFGIFEIGSIICGVANSSMTLIIGRAVSGMGSSGLINGALTIIAGAAPIHKRPTILGLMMGVAQLGLVLGPLVGGAFTTYTTWRWCFYINLPIGGLVAVLLVFTRIPEQRIKPPALTVLPTFFRTFDLLGFALFAPAAIMFLLALEYGGNEYAWNSPTVIGLFVGSGATALVFLAWEYYKGRDAMIPFHLLTIRIAWTSYVATAFIFGLTMVVAYYVPVYFQAVRDDSALMSGVNLLPNILSQLISAVIVGILIGRLGYYLPFAILGGALSAVGAGLLSRLSPSTSTVAWAAYQIIMGLGRGPSTQPSLVAVQNSVAPDDLSTAMAILTFSQTFGGSVFLSIASVIFSEGLKDQIPRFAPNVDADVVISAGATGFRDIVEGGDLRGILQAYSKAVDWVFYLVAGLAVVQTVASCGIGWVDIRPRNKKVGKAKKNGRDEEKGEA